MNIIVFELILVASAALGLGFWQLYDVNSELRKHRDEDGRTRLHQARQAPEDQAKDRDDECG